LGIKDKKLMIGDLVTAKTAQWATKHLGAIIDSGSLGIITIMNDEGIAVYWFKQCIQGAIKPHGTRTTLLRRASRPKR